MEVDPRCCCEHNWVVIVSQQLTEGSSHVAFGVTRWLWERTPPGQSWPTVLKFFLEAVQFKKNRKTNSTERAFACRLIVFILRHVHTITVPNIVRLFPRKSKKDRNRAGGLCDFSQCETCTKAMIRWSGTGAQNKLVQTWDNPKGTQWACESWSSTVLSLGRREWTAAVNKNPEWNRWSTPAFQSGF